MIDNRMTKAEMQLLQLLIERKQNRENGSKIYTTEEITEEILREQERKVTP